MALLENHLEQISLSAAAIAELPFPPPKRFANALLRFHDITALIRDTEVHERALFRFAPPDPSSLPPQEKISSLHSRFNQLTASVTRYENRVSKNATQLAKLNRSGDDRDADDEHLDRGASPDLESGERKFSEMPITAEQLEREEQEVRELERRKQNLEERVSGMERDLGGLLR
ncbi:MAG: hypothetical protein LQ348_000039 [Seirophora lacunosa]|nr:MAG: hypothetical protein LQ348_000039 [Seirophora lacunosa]